MLGFNDKTNYKTKYKVDLSTGKARNKNNELLDKIKEELGISKDLLESGRANACKKQLERLSKEIEREGK